MGDYGIFPMEGNAFFHQPVDEINPALPIIIKNIPYFP